MSNIDKQALREVAEKATKGEWWSDVVETGGEYGEGEDRVSGYHSYAVYVGNESLLDMTNSTAACIHTEWDHDYHMAWDETAKRNAEFIAAANPATVLELLDENIQLQREKDAIEAVALALRDDMRQAREQLEAAEKLNAVQQRSLEHCKFLLSSTCEVQRDFAEALGCAGDNESIMEAIDDLKQHIAELESKNSNLRTIAHEQNELAIRINLDSINDAVEMDSLQKRIAELEAKLETADRLQDGAFRDGLKAGFSYGQTDDQSGYEQCLKSYSSRGKDNG